MEPEKVRSLFLLSQIGIALIIIGLVFWFKNKSTDSGFKVREADRVKKPTGEGTGKRQEPLRLTGFKLNAPAHEILGISPQATSKEIQKAYRDMMKRYHPDKVGRPGSREWNDAQKIAEAINRAKEEMLQAHKRSG
jgi:DnaJ-class molecular chaperone